MKRIIAAIALMTIAACSSLTAPQVSHKGCAGGEDATHLWHNQRCLEART